MAATMKRPAPTELSNGATTSMSPVKSSKTRKLSVTSAPTNLKPRTINELISARAGEVETKDEPIISYPHHGTEYTHYTPVQLNDLADKAAAYYSKTIIKRRVSSDEPVQVIALLSLSDFDYFVTALAISKLGHTALFLSTRISEEAHVSLLEVTNATCMLTDASFRKMGEKVTSRFSGIALGPIARLSDLANESSRAVNMTLDPERETENVAWIIHSSGSTSLPKPVFITHSAAIGNYNSPFPLVGFVTLPLFHAHGLSCVFRAITVRKRIYIYNASLPLTAKHLIATLKQHQDIQIFYSVPYSLKLLAEDVEGTALLAKLDVVMSGGSACPKPIGDKLVRNGVMLVSHYGTTETGQLMNTFRERSDLDWDFLRPSDALKPYLEWDEYAPGISELVVKSGWPSKVATNRKDGSFATKDLFEKHPTLEAYRYYARKDDTIVLVNGEKANPLLLEGVARENPSVAEVVVFGQQKPQLGMFVVPASAQTTQEEIQEAVFPAIEEANAVMPAHARMHKDMIRVLPADQEYRKTDKGTVIRAAFYKQFAEAIDSIYEEDAPKGSLALSETELRAFLRETLEQIVDVDRFPLLQDDTDLFSLGVDSLQSSRIRSTVLKDIDIGDEKLRENFVFDFPSINAMAAELLRLRTGQQEAEKRSIEERMQELIDKYSAFETHRPVVNEAQGEYIVVTGATGSLGAHLVAKLAARADVARIYCLVRAKSPEKAQQRIRASMTERRVEDALDNYATKVVGIPATFSSPDLGLSSQQYNEITANLTNVIHCAWSVNFNLGLESFEADCIAGTKHLIDLCIRAKRPRPASFNFCSSVSAVQGAPVSESAEELPPSLSWAQNMGYARGKLVTEHIVMNAASRAGVRARVLRTGQIIGDTEHGVWNSQEAIPMILQCARTIGCLPALDESPSWLPVDTVAAGIAELSLPEAEQTQDSGVYHVVNHKTFHWTRDLLPLLKQTGLSFEAVDQREWLGRLRAKPDPVANPPFKLAEFFAGKYDRDTPRKGVKCLNDRARAESPAIAQAPILDENMARAFIGYLTTVWDA